MGKTRDSCQRPLFATSLGIDLGSVEDLEVECTRDCLERLHSLFVLPLVSLLPVQFIPEFPPFPILIVSSISARWSIDLSDVEACGYRSSLFETALDFAIAHAGYVRDDGMQDFVSAILHVPVKYRLGQTDAEDALKTFDNELTEDGIPWRLHTEAVMEKMRKSPVSMHCLF